MNVWVVVLLAFAMMVVATNESHAQQSPEFIIPLDTAVPGAGTIAGQSGDPFTADVNINLDALSQPSMNLTVFGETIQITHETTFFKNATEYTYVGNTPGSKGNVYIAVIGDMARLELESPRLDYILEPSGNAHKIIKYNALGFIAQDENTRLPPLNQDHPRIVASAPRGTFTTDLYEPLEIDVIFLYTDAVFEKFEPNAHIDIRLIANIALSRANFAFRSSDIPLVLNDVGRDNAGSGYKEVTLETDLERLIARNDRHLDVGYAERERENADIGVLLGSYTESTAYCGRASSILASPDNAFVVANVECNEVETYDPRSIRFGKPLGQIITHEIGHLFGARHEVKFDSATVPFPYGHGYRDTSKNMATLMGFCERSGQDDPNCEWTSQWSDPNNDFFLTNTVSGTEQSENNARVITQMGPYIASFRGGAETYQPVFPPPTIKAPRDVRIEATGMLTEVELGEPTVKKDRRQDVKIKRTGPDLFPVGRTFVIWSVEDQLGQINLDSQTIRVEDTTGPVLSRLPDSITMESQSPTGTRVSFASPIATDLVDRNRPVTAEPRSGSIFSVGDTTVTFTASDEAGNISTHTITVTVTYQDPTTIVTPDRTLFTDDFESGLISWTMSGNSDWATGSPHLPVPGQTGGNLVLKSADCGSRCTVTLKTSVSSTKPMVVEFDRFVGS